MTVFYFRFKETSQNLRGSYSGHSCSSQISLMRQIPTNPALLVPACPHTIKTFKAVTLLARSVINFWNPSFQPPPHNLPLNKQPRIRIKPLFNIVLVSSGSHIKILESYTTDNCFSWFWSLESPESRYLVRTFFLAYRLPPSYYILTWWRESERERKQASLLSGLF